MNRDDDPICYTENMQNLFSWFTSEEHLISKLFTLTFICSVLGEYVLIYLALFCSSSIPSTAGLGGIPFLGFCFALPLLGIPLFGVLFLVLLGLHYLLKSVAGRIVLVILLVGVAIGISLAYGTVR